MKHIRRAIALGILSLHALPAWAMRSRNESVTQTMVINAPVPVVWEALKTARVSNPERKRVVSVNGSDYTIEEVFPKIPVLGDVTCRYIEHEIEGKKVEYQMISSDKFVAFEGEWDLSPVNAGKQTTLTLSSFVDTGCHLPFAANITRERTKTSVSTRLNAVKELIAMNFNRPGAHLANCATK
jgi:Polyketide cyclase / dehydrase and lipid transport